MQLIKFQVVGLVLFAMTWRGDTVIAPPNPDKLSNRMVEDLVQILTSCYGDRIRGVGLVGNSFGTLARTLSTQHLIPVVMFDTAPFMPGNVSRPAVQFHQTMQIFIMDASIFEDFSSTIQRSIYTTIWWNHMASFYILSRAPKCSDGADLLHILWILNIRNGKVMCNHFSNGRRVILSFNPYTNHAPAVWKSIYAFRAINNNSFTMFYRLYDENKSMCVDLDFDTTNDLGGYEISVAVESRHEVSTEARRNLNRYFSTIERILHNIFCSLNATPKFMPLISLEDHIDTDMVKIGSLMLNTWQSIKITYPYRQTGLIIISKFSGHKSQLEKILCVIDFYSRCGMVIVYFVTLIFFVSFVRQGLVPAFLNLVRMTCDTSFLKLPNNNATRIYLTCLLFFVVTMQGIYQGNLASLLTTIIPIRNVEVMQDLVDLDYEVYGNDFARPVVEQYPELKGRFTVSERVDDCIAHTMNDSSAACIRNVQGLAVDLARRYELHASDKFVATFYSAFRIRWDWPPEAKVNIILSRMVEGDLILPWHIKCAPLNFTDLKYDREVRNNQPAKKIELAELAFAFVILGIGLVCATVTFVVEVAFHRYKLRTVNISVVYF